MKNGHYNRTILLSGYIDSDSVKEVISFINEINEYDRILETELAKYDREAIILQVNTFGGSVYDGWALVSAIETSVTPVVTLALGSVMSMGIPIFLAGHERMTTEYSTFMYHEISTSFRDSKMQEITESVFQLKHLQKLYDEYLLKKTTIKSEKLKEIKRGKKDYFFTPQNALEWGFVSGIIKIGEEGMEVVDK